MANIHKVQYCYKIEKKCYGTAYCLKIKKDKKNNVQK